MDIPLKSSGGSCRVTVSIPKLLKARMNKLRAGRGHSVNWSKAAAQSFERICDELEKSRER